MSLKLPAVDIPEDLLWALDYHTDANTQFHKLPYVQRRVYVAWIERARKPETRAQRVEQAILRIMQAEHPQA